MKEYGRIREIIDLSKDIMVENWMRISRDGAAGDLQAMDRTVQLIRQLFENEGFHCRLESAGEGVPPVLIGSRGAEQGETPILFSGHYDTVFQEGEWKEPAKVTEDGLIRGPGVLDMKGGIIAALFIARVLGELGESDCPLKIIFVGDEEVGHEKGEAAEILVRESAGSLWAFNMETGFENQDVCIGRKGTAACRLSVEGVGGHPGNAFEKGRNAIVEMAQKILELSRLTDLERGITVSAGKIQGGTAANVVAAGCTAELDLRFSTMKDYEELKMRIKQICDQPYIEGTTTKMTYSEMLPPYETTDEVMELYHCLKRAADELGRPVITGRVRGGASDAAYIGRGKTPVLCAMGVRGAASHSTEEYAVVESLMERTELLAYLILNRERLKQEVRC